jgi:hypothetical protein
VIQKQLEALNYYQVYVPSRLWPDQRNQGHTDTGCPSSTCVVAILVTALWMQPGATAGARFPSASCVVAIFIMACQMEPQATQTPDFQAPLCSCPLCRGMLDATTSTWKQTITKLIMCVCHLGYGLPYANKAIQTQEFSFPRSTCAVASLVLAC